ncbi:PA1571 family protein [Halopseudomonas yangmingensis]|uniref:Uncharacterized protein n=1 Tax=Halopseudomonas yangmingensis TaxID=1720063 RepID=A0A1I4NMV1_9GAMM|nr:PA1571 family protein [Halopseudomonas yangmingensis]SFM16864.1 hypothetical protein SAMN05216217_101433 [Halopseudomonas yangmingensis]
MNAAARSTRNSLPFNPLASSPAAAGWLLDSEGREREITEQMILQACEQLEQLCLRAQPALSN